jgi:hypothetical protein
LRMYIMRKFRCCSCINVEFNGQWIWPFRCFEGIIIEFMLQLISANWYGPNGLFKTTASFRCCGRNVKAINQMMNVVDDVWSSKKRNISVENS